MDTFLFAGSPYATGVTAVGLHDFYLTQTNGTTGCESDPDTVILTINDIPAAPFAADTAICFGDPLPELIATATGNVVWYDDTALTNVVAMGDTFLQTATASGDYIYYLTQEVNGCESDADTVVLRIDSLPAAPSANDTSNCFGVSNVPLIAIGGVNVEWYEEAGLITLLHQGDTFTSSETNPGSYTYYLAALNTATGCYSTVDSLVFTIHAIPSAPLVADTAICFGRTDSRSDCQWQQHSVVRHGQSDQPDPCWRYAGSWSDSGWGAPVLCHSDSEWL